MHFRFVSNLNVSGLHSGTGEPILDDLTPPLGLLCLAGSLQRTGHDSSIVDLNYAIAQSLLKLDSKFILSAADVIRSEKADVYAFSTMCNSFHISLRLASVLHDLEPSATILFGGPQISFVAKETMERFPFIDFVLRGECDHTIGQFADTLDGSHDMSEIPGLVRRVSSEILATAPPTAIDDLDLLPFPAWKLFPHDPGESASIDVGRGCPFDCRFCSTSVFFQRKFRLKSFDRIAEEMRFLRDRYGSSGVNFVHDLFTANRKWVRAFCEYLTSQIDLKGMTWAASARIDTISNDLLAAMGQAGCRGLFYGVESGSPRMQGIIGKRLKLDQVTAIADVARQNKIACTMSFIAGFPQETLVDLRATFSLIAQLLKYPGTALQLHLMSPMVGTNDFHTYQDRLKLDQYYSDISSSPQSLLELSWFAEMKSLFSSFYYFENKDIPRSLLIGIDKFVRIICTAMRRSVLSMLKDSDDLWELYVLWQQWCHDRQTGNEASRAKVNVVEPDEIILEFLSFAESGGGKPHLRRVDFSVARDELLAFYLHRYHSVTSAWVIEQREGHAQLSPAL
jgi:radical SAM superfamily enzyme YgiQ (UPF0313 family)